MIDTKSTPIKKRRLGKSDLQVTSIGLGCWQFSGLKGSLNFWNSPPQEEVDKIVKIALEGGINWFDTAELYGRGTSERALATALCKAGMANGDVVIATKWLPIFRTAGNIPRTIGNRLECLSPCKIDLYQIHMPYAFSSIEAQMDAMAGLVKDGKIRYIGVSNFSANQMRRAHTALAKYGLPLVSNQVRYSLVNRNLEKNGVLDVARELDTSLIAYSPLAQGLLTGKFHKNPELVKKLPYMRRMSLGRRVEKTRGLIKKLEDIADSHNCTASEVALSWVVNYHGDVMLAIPGATKTEQVHQNIGALTLKLTPEELAGLDKESRLIS
ncbi:MAG: aldo/keto reductase [Dehalococcoidales bacterium]|nr:aldo/keto reductase [Dehalococcoidales bacterium]